MTTLTTPANSASAPSRNGTADPAPLRAAHTPNFPALLRQLGASLLVTHPSCLAHRGLSALRAKSGCNVGTEIPVVSWPGANNTINDAKESLP
jgi:hypothetical protein